MNDGNGRRGCGGAWRRLWRCVAQEYATKFLPLGGHEHMFWVFESAQKNLAFVTHHFYLFRAFFRARTTGVLLQTTVLLPVRPNR